MSVEHLHPVQRRGRAIGSVFRATSIRAALDRLAEGGCRPIAGGTDLLLELERGGPGDAVDLIDLSSIADGGFDAIIDLGDHLGIGGGVTHNQVVGNPQVVETALPLAQACVEVGSPQLRNRATLAGNLATASPANDSISALLALDATVELSRIDNIDNSVVATRSVPLDQFFVGFRETVLQPGELITRIVVPKLAPDARGIWVKLGLRKAQAISVVHAGLVVALDQTNTITHARLAIGSVAPTVVVIGDVASALVGRQLDDAAIDAAASAARLAVQPISDVRASAEYRSESVSLLVRRSLNVLAQNRQAEMWLAAPPLLTAGRRPGTPLAVTSEGPLLLDQLRADGFDGVKEGCAEGECGACTVLVNGAAVMSCLVPAASAGGQVITTVESLSNDDALAPIQQAFIDEFAAQCGFCIPGFVVAGAALLDEHADPNDDQIKMAFSGNLCRCTGYYPIIQAVKTAAARRRSAQ